MDPCPFVRIVVGNLGLKFMGSSVSQSCYCKFKLRGFNTQYSNVPLLVQESDAIESRNHACFNLSKTELEKLVEKSSSNGKFPSLKIEIYGGNRVKNCGFVKNGKLLGCIVCQLNLKGVLESGSNRGLLIQNGWVLINGSEAKLHLNVKAEPDPRFVFQFDGEPECSPQVFQVKGNVKQPVFTCKFSFRSSGERNLRSR
ncbi:uncharacterized protein LOC111383649 [Olea europaea var. sylvestris]|uniref:uncharacterized protein LOC111383649 n=1 Tax=Olea europaea var. sylvestris TaxID=158386 RepID=UPI000C1CFD90|nr:uncharacterized protein LOC111383649 [Olea europaea var. sylvestris]